MRETLASIDLVLEIRDARLPLTSINPEFEKLFGSDRGLLPKNGKKRLVIYNKRDLAEPGLERVCRLFCKFSLSAENMRCVATSPFKKHFSSMLANYAFSPMQLQITTFAIF